MQSINTVTLIGKLARDPMITTGEKAKANFTINTAKPYKDQEGEWKEIQEYAPCSVWGKGAEALQGAKKDDYFIVEGRLNTRSWETEDGERKYATEVNVSRVVAITEKVAHQIQKAEKSEEVEKSTTLDNLPF